MKDKLIAKALKDPKFREALKKDPIGTAEKELGVKVRKGVTVKIVEDTADTVHLVLPPAAASGKLSEKDLEGIAGGKCLMGSQMCNLSTYEDPS